MSDRDEEWRAIPGFDDKYEASNLGRIRRVGAGRNNQPGKILKPFARGTKKRPYLAVNLWHDGRGWHKYVHVLVMRTFVGEKPPGHDIDHLDNDPGNPALANLEYTTRSEQVRRAYYRDGYVPYSIMGDKNHWAKLTWDQVNEIRRRLKSKECSGRALGREFGVSQSCISSIAIGHTWRDLSE